MSTNKGSLLALVDAPASYISSSPADYFFCLYVCAKVSLLPSSLFLSLSLFIGLVNLFCIFFFRFSFSKLLSVFYFFSFVSLHGDFLFGRRPPAHPPLFVFTTFLALGRQHDSRPDLRVQRYRRERERVALRRGPTGSTQNTCTRAAEQLKKSRNSPYYTC